MGFTLEVENYRALRKVRWSPSGVCAITGPNGAGKTTVLSVIEFLRHFLERGIQGAAEFVGGTAGIRNQLAAPTDTITILLSHGEWRWLVSPIAKAPFLDVEEHLEQEGKFSADRHILDGSVHVGTLVIPQSNFSAFTHSLTLLPVDQRASLQGFYNLVSSFRLYRNIQSWHSIVAFGSTMSADLWLHPGGQNIFSALRNWKAGRREHEERWIFVREGMRECFPELFDDIDFLFAGHTVTAQFYLRGLPEPIDLFAVPHGMLVALFLLCAVASTPDHGAVAIDEMENGLHPYAIRTLLELMRARAAARDLTILLATHSPVVLNTFNTEPERVYIMEPGHEVLPIALSEHSNPEWLAHFSLGDLYSDQTFGAQRRPPQ